ncbi:MAG: carotenoid biosynthesis protein [Deltaproteobacteria bacterium]|nr:carotenoid biosynthesis protein [Deltaproteobacteria bacterium]
MPEIPQLLLGTFLFRPYVFVFLGIYVLSCATAYGLRTSLSFLVLGYLIAFASEFSSIHNGFPYGHYYYIPTTTHRELWIAGVPFMDSISYVFMSYAGYGMALFLRTPSGDVENQEYWSCVRKVETSWRTLVLGAVLFVFLDVIIDPVAFRGDRWFLGKIYGYREEGFYFGIPLSNFLGWLFVGFALIKTFQLLLGSDLFRAARGLEPGRAKWSRLLGPVLYGLIVLGNLSVTFWIGEAMLGLAGSGMSAILLFFVIRKVRRRKQHLPG